MALQQHSLDVAGDVIFEGKVIVRNVRKDNDHRALVRALLVDLESADRASRSLVAEAPMRTSKSIVSSNNTWCEARGSAVCQSLEV